jgi:dipeptidyl aminopeptidase/acylaminoacyl peptidase
LGWGLSWFADCGRVRNRAPQRASGRVRSGLHKAELLEESELVVVRGSEIAALSGKFDLSETFPVGWSPDGTRLAFIAAEPNGHHTAVFIVNADGTGLRRLTSPANDAETAAWSPDGTQIATRIAGRLLIVNADGPRNPTYSGLSRSFGPILIWNPAH